MKMFSVCGTYALLSSCGPVGQWVMSSSRAISKHFVATESVMPMVAYMAINLWKLLALHRRAALDYARVHRNTTNPKLGGGQQAVEAVHVAMALLLEHLQNLFSSCRTKSYTQILAEMIIICWS